MRFNASWKQRLAENMGPDGWPGVVAYSERTERQGGWNKGYGAWRVGVDFLSDALEVAFAEPSHTYVKVFQNYALLVLDKARNDLPRWTEDGDWGRSPLGGMNWFETVAPHEIVKAWSINTNVDPRAVLEGCSRFLEAAKEIKGSGLWNHIAQYKYLTAVLLSLTFGGVEKAKPMLALRKSYKATQEFRSWIEGLVKLWPTDGHPASSECMAHFNALYEKVRDPDWRKDLPSTREEEAAGSFYPGKKSLFLLQLGLLRWHGLEKRTLAGNWPNLIEEISA